MDKLTKEKTYEEMVCEMVELSQHVKNAGIEYLRCCGAACSQIKLNEAQYGNRNVEYFCEEVSEASETDLKPSQAYMAARLYDAIGDEGFDAAIAHKISIRNLQYLGSQKLQDNERIKMLTAICDGTMPQTALKDMVQLTTDKHQTGTLASDGAGGGAQLPSERGAGGSDTDLPPGVTSPLEAAQDDEDITGYASDAEMVSAVAYFRNLPAVIKRAAKIINMAAAKADHIVSGGSEQAMRDANMYASANDLQASMDTIDAALNLVDVSVGKINKVCKKL